VNGLLIVDKPAGTTSAQVVQFVKRRLRCKTGHLGTLDPFATGILPLCLGEGTKIAQFLNAADKEYIGSVRLGERTDTGDPTGEIVERAAIPDLDDDALAMTASRFCGTQRQTPPMYSALKRQGTPLYKLARQGIEVEREDREIFISSLTLKRVDRANLDFKVSCSKGTYVRVLAEDIAQASGTVGYLTSLRRTRFGEFGMNLASTLDDVADGRFKMIGMREALGHVREIVLDEVASRRARRGDAPLLQMLTGGQPDEIAKLVAADGSLAAVVTMESGRGWRFARVFPAPQPITV